MTVTVYGVNYTIHKNASSIPATGQGTLVGPSAWNGPHRYDEYTTDGTETSGSFIYLGVLRMGERFFGGLAAWPIIKTAGTIILGDGGWTAAQATDKTTAVVGDDDRYLVSSSTAAASTATGVECCAQTGLGFKNDSTVDVGIYATTGGATYASGKKIQVVLRFGQVGGF